MNGVSGTSIRVFDPALKSRQALPCRLLESALERGSLANAYLLTGRAPEDKVEFAKQLAAYLNCEKRSSTGSCLSSAQDARCRNCEWIGQNAHPQAWIMLSGEGKSQKIPVEKARQLTDELTKTSSFYRVIVVPESDEVTFHRPAANALLKDVEEPPPGCLFIFMAEETQDVLSTIVSRCQVIPFTTKLTLGYWDFVPDEDGVTVEAKAALSALRSNLVMKARSYAKQAGHAAAWKHTADALEMSKQLLEVCKELEEQTGSDLSRHVIDMVAASEVEVFQEVAQRDPGTCKYLSGVLQLAETAKRQIKQYVKPSNAIESFCLSLSQLRQNSQER